MDELIERRKKTLKRPADVVKRCLDWNPQRACRTGRPNNTWSRTIVRKVVIARALGKQWREVKALAVTLLMSFAPLGVNFVCVKIYIFYLKLLANRRLALVSMVATLLSVGFVRILKRL